MGLTAGTGAGNYLEKDEWLALGKEGALVACVVAGHGTKAMTTGPSAGKDVDRVMFDLYVLDGKRKGEVHVGQDVIGRGLVAPLMRVKIGEEVAYRVAVGKNMGNDYPQLNAPGDLATEAIGLFEGLKDGSIPAANAEAAPNTGNGTKEKATAGATASSGSSSAGDDPDF